MKKKINIGLLGLGTVGSGVYKTIKRRRQELKRLVQADLVVKKVAIKDLSELTDRNLVRIDRRIVTTNAMSIINDPDIDIIVEVIGGKEPARRLILKAISNGKQVVTANKEVMANFGEEVFAEADRQGVDVYFEASVGGGIPIIGPLKRGLVANKISQVTGIVNGTTNYILSRMQEDGTSFREALKEAKDEGYAEPDPRKDINGQDAADKIAILASIAFNARVRTKDVYHEGISKILPQDIEYAKEMGYCIKLLAIGREDKDGLDVRVHPTMIPCEHPLASVTGVYNAIFVEGDAVGEVMFFGQGAGSMPAASAIVSDVVEVARNLQYDRSGKIGCTCFNKKTIKPVSDTVTSFYILIDALDRAGVLAKIAKAFGESDVSLASVIQRRTHRGRAELVFFTHPVKGQNLNKARISIEKLDVVKRVLNIIRVDVH